MIMAFASKPPSRQAQETICMYGVGYQLIRLISSLCLAIIFKIQYKLLGIHSIKTHKSKNKVQMTYFSIFLFKEKNYFLYSILVMQNMSCLRQEPVKKRYKQLVVLQKYMHIQRQIQENSVRLFQKFHGNSQKHWSPNPSNYLSQQNSKEKIHTQSNDSEYSHKASGQSTLRHVTTNPAVLNSFRKIVKGSDQRCQKLPSYLSNTYQMMNDQRQANLLQRKPTERKKKARHTYNVFAKQTSLLQRSYRLSSFKGHQEEKSPTLKETTIRVKISMLKKEKWNIISRKTIDSSDSLLVRPPPFSINIAQMKQPVKLKRNYSNMYQIYGINQSRKKVENRKIESIQDEWLSTARIEPWSDQNS